MAETIASEYFPTSEGEYATWFTEFRKLSNQYVQMEQLMDPVMREYTDRPINLLSIGAGTGSFEEFLVQKYGLKLAYFHAIEPNRYHRDGLKKVMDRLKVDFKMDAASFDKDTVVDKKFDLILIIHVLYALPNPAEMIKKARSFLKPDGKIIVTLQGEDGFFQIFSSLTGKINFCGDGVACYKPLTYERLCADLAKLNIPHDVKETQTRINVTEFMKRESTVVASFMIQTSFDKLSQEDQQMVYDAFDSRCVQDEEGRFFWPLKNAVIIINF